MGKKMLFFFSTHVVCPIPDMVDICDVFSESKISHVNIAWLLGKLKSHMLLHTLFLQVLLQFALFAAKMKLSLADRCFMISGAIVLNRNQLEPETKTPVTQVPPSPFTSMASTPHTHTSRKHYEVGNFLPWWSQESYISILCKLENRKVKKWRIYGNATGQELTGFVNCGPQICVACESLLDIY